MNNQSDGETGVKHINVINMYDTDKIHPEKLAFSNYEEDAVKKCNVEFGDIFLTRSSLKPEGIAEANVLLNSGRFVYDDHLIRVKVNKEKYDPFFVKLNLSGNAFKRQFIVRAKTTAFTTIGQEDISECLGSFPKKEEQQQIGECFMVIDHLITLHQRKYLQKKKTSLTWEQRKLGDEATEMLAGGDIDKSRVVENGQYPIYANALTNDGIVGYYDDYYRVKAPAVTVTGRGDVGHAQARIDDFTPVVRLLAIRSEHDVYFLENAINKHVVIVESTGVPQLTVPQLGNYIISFPTTTEEEIKIGSYFHNLDHLISLHRRAHFHRRRRTYK